LANLLSDAIRRKQDPRQVGRQDGHRRGFRPTRVERGRRVDFVLGRCPFAEVAISDPDTFCQLHRGMAEGLTEGLDGLAVEKLLPKDPRRAGCRLTVRRATTGTGAPA
jgi:predicted ArsR family transcriptional regulator